MGASLNRGSAQLITPFTNRVSGGDGGRFKLSRKKSAGLRKQKWVFKQPGPQRGASEEGRTPLPYNKPPRGIPAGKVKALCYQGQDKHSIGKSVSERFSEIVRRRKGRANMGREDIQAEASG